jgi:hypothetical protein
VSQTNAGVAGRALNDSAARRQLAAALGGGDDGAGRTIFHGAARIHELGFAQDLAAGFLTHGPEPDQGRIADRAGKSVGDTHTRAPCDN